MSKTLKHPTIQIQQARSSEKCDLPLKIVFLDPDNIGIHEDHNPKKLAAVLASILKEGYSGPAIAVMPSENSEIFQRAKNLTVLTTNAELETGIIDGHNRLVAFKILRILEVLNFDLIPAQLIPIPSNLVYISSLFRFFKPIPISKIQKINSSPGKTLSHRSPSHFRIKINDGSNVRIRDGQPDVIIPRAELLDLENFDASIIERKAQYISPFISIEKLKEILLGAEVL